MRRYDAVLFDVDGTLLHSRPGILDAFSFTFRSMGLPGVCADLNRYLGPPLRQSFSEHFKTREEVERAVQIYRARYAEHGMHMCSPFPGVAAMLDTLRASGVLLATATSKPTAVVKPILREQGIDSYFSWIGGASLDASIDTKTAVIRSVLAQPFMHGRRVLMVGDRKDDLQGAAACGIPAAAVLYGYGCREEYAEYPPVFIASDCTELTDYILST